MERFWPPWEVVSRSFPTKVAMRILLEIYLEALAGVRSQRGDMLTKIVELSSIPPHLPSQNHGTRPPLPPLPSPCPVVSSGLSKAFGNTPMSSPGRCLPRRHVGGSFPEVVSAKPELVSAPRLWMAMILYLIQFSLC